MKHKNMGKQNFLAMSYLLFFACAILLCSTLANSNYKVHIADACGILADEQIIDAETFASSLDTSVLDFNKINNYLLSNNVLPIKILGDYVVPPIKVDSVTQGINTVEMIAESILYQEVPELYDTYTLKEGYTIGMSSLGNLENDMYFSTEIGTLDIFIVDNSGNKIYSTTVTFSFIYD